MKRDRKFFLLQITLGDNAASIPLALNRLKIIENSEVRNTQYVIYWEVQGIV